MAWRQATAIAVAVLVPVASADAQAPGFLDPAARIYTVAGSGTSPPANGMAATEARLRIERLAAAPDGTIVFTEESGSAGGWRIDLNGRLRELPALVVDGARARAHDIDVASDGTLLAVAGVDGRLHRLPPGAVAWDQSSPLTERGLGEVAALPDGGALVAGFDFIWRLGPRGETVWRRRAPGDLLGQPSTDHLVALPGDGAAALGASGAGLSVLEADGGERRIGSALVNALTALGDGTLIVLRSTGAIRVHRPGVPPQTLFGLAPELGRGDGGVARHALFETGENDAIAAGPGGELLVADDSTLDALGDLDMEAFRFGTSLVTDFSLPQRRGELLRVIAPDSRPTSAIRPETYRTIRDRTVAMTSSFAGTATLTISQGLRTAAQVTAAVPAGDSRLALPARLPPADYRLELSVADAARRVSHRIALSTRRRVDLYRARRTIRRVLRGYEVGGDGTSYELRARGCRRASALRIRCALWSRYTNFTEVVERCRGRVVARQRPDGLRVFLRQRRSLCPATDRPSR